MLSIATSLTSAMCSCMADAAASALPAWMASAIFRCPCSDLSGLPGWDSD